MYISKWVQGFPVPQPRPRATIRNSRVHIYNKNTAKEWKNSIKIAFIDYANTNLDEPLSVEIMYYIKRPKSLLRKKDPFDIIPHIKKPDLDNLDKAVLDSLTDINVWLDDSRVFSLKSCKYYTDKENMHVGANISIYT